MNDRAKNVYAALLAALMMLGGLTACGDSASDDISEKPAKTDRIAEELSSAVDESTESESKDSDSKTDDKASGSKKDSDSKKSDDKNDSSSSVDSGNAASDSSSESSDHDSSQTDAPHTEADNNHTTAATQPANDHKTTTTTAAPAVTDDADDSDPEDAEKPTKYIYLQDTTAQYSGDGIAVQGSQIVIGKGGTYEISGTLTDGQILVVTDKKKVKLHLNGVSITNTTGSAICCQNAKKLTINSLPGTVNYLEDGGVHDADKGTIFSEDTVQIKGEGELNIQANYAHGIQSDDDIIINSGTLNIASTKSCLHSNDGIEINGGNNYCLGGTNGIKTDGYINITGGSSVFIGGVREEKGAIYCDGPLSVTGGNFWAVGNTCTMPDAALTTANVIGVMFANAQPAGTLVNVSSDGNGIFTMSSPNRFKYVVYTGPELLLNAEYNVNYGGSTDGIGDHYVYFGGSYTDGTDGGSFIADNPISVYTIS